MRRVLEVGFKLLGYFVIGHSVVEIVRYATRAEVDHLHEHQHGAEAAIDELDRRLVRLENAQPLKGGEAEPQVN